MATLKELNLRIGSLTSTRKITQAMKLIATTKLNRFQSKVRHSITYHQCLNKVFSKAIHYIRNHPDSLEENPLWSIPRGNKVLLLLFTSDRGLCGSFNYSVIKEANELSIKLREEGKEVFFDCYGKKGFDSLKRRKLPIGLQHEAVFDETYNEIVAEDFAKQYFEGFISNRFDELYLVYNTYVSAINQKSHNSKVLPFKLGNELILHDEKSQKIKQSQEDTHSFSGLFEPDLEIFLSNLIKKFVQFEFYFAFLNSATGEHAARMTSMDNATNNSNDMIDRLTLERNRLRQAAITKELIEIISGAESV